MKLKDVITVHIVVSVCICKAPIAQTNVKIAKMFNKPKERWPKNAECVKNGRASTREREMEGAREMEKGREGGDHFAKPVF